VTLAMSMTMDMIMGWDDGERIIRMPFGVWEKRSCALFGVGGRQAGPYGLMLYLLVAWVA
jgi:hypothetical protein